MTIETGPKLQNDSFDVLLRFRKHEITIACDISEMYLRVGICEPYRKYNRILWDDTVYAFTRLVFGVNTPPFLAQIVAQTNARKYADLYPLTWTIQWIRYQKNKALNFIISYLNCGQKQACMQGNGFRTQSQYLKKFQRKIEQQRLI